MVKSVDSKNAPKRTLNVGEIDAGLGPTSSAKADPAKSKKVNWALNADAVRRAVEPELEVSVGDRKFSKAQLKEAIAVGLGEVASVIGDRSRALPADTAWGPNFGDATYLFRLGDQLRGKSGDPFPMNDSYGIDAQLMSQVRAVWEERGMPVPSREELAAMQLVNLKTRIETRPDVVWVPKHYPGGNHLLEVTEKNAVSFAGAPRATAPWVNQWDAIFRMKKPPKFIMLAHAQYAPENFGFASNAKFTSKLLNKHFAFADLPASLNPLLVAHLHGERNYQGLTIGDWYDMGAIRQFVSGIKLHPAAKDKALHLNAVVTSLAIEADVDVVSGQKSDVTDLATYLRSLPNFAEIDSALTASLQRTSARLQSADLISLGGMDLKAKSFEERLSLKRGGAIRRLEYDQIRPMFRATQDIWNRQGVLVLAQRVKTIEKLSGTSIAKPPTSIENEEAWAEAVLANPTFKAFNSKIPWDSPQMKALFEESFQVTAAAMARGEPPATH